MLLNTIEYGDRVWDAYVGPAQGSGESALLELIFVPREDGSVGTSYFCPIDRDLLQMLERAAMGVSDGVLRRLLDRAVAEGRTADTSRIMDDDPPAPAGE